MTETEQPQAVPVMLVMDAARTIAEMHRIRDAVMELIDVGTLTDSVIGEMHRRAAAQKRQTEEARNNVAQERHLTLVRDEEDV